MTRRKSEITARMNERDYPHIVDIIGAVGISGDTSERDEACAIAGIEAAGLKADPGQDAS